jgi:hypothetical protein
MKLTSLIRLIITAAFVAVLVVLAQGSFTVTPAVAAPIVASTAAAPVADVGDGVYEEKYGIYPSENLFSLGWNGTRQMNLTGVYSQHESWQVTAAWFQWERYSWVPNWVPDWLAAGHLVGYAIVKGGGQWGPVREETPWTTCYAVAAPDIGAMDVTFHIHVRNNIAGSTVVDIVNQTRAAR